jgi:PHP family Zn ribbon phosphoesterase
MSNVLDYIEKNPKESQRLLGLKYEQFKQLLEKVIELHDHKVKLAESKKVQIIKGGGGRKPKISLSEQVILNLTYGSTFDNISTAWHSIWSK